MEFPCPESIIEEQNRSPKGRLWVQLFLHWLWPCNWSLFGDWGRNYRVLVRTLAFEASLGVRNCASCIFIPLLLTSSMTTLTTVTLKYGWKVPLLERGNRRTLGPLLSPTHSYRTPAAMLLKKELLLTLHKFCLIHCFLEINQTGGVFRSPLEPKDLFIPFNCFSEPISILVGFVDQSPLPHWFKYISFC